MTARVSICALLLLLLGATAAQAEGTFERVIAVAPAQEGSSIAIEIAMDGQGALAGLTWFHNDGGQVFPRVVIVEGEAGSAPDLTNPGLILDQVTGVSMDWGQLSLSEPVTSSTGTAFAVFFFPPGEETTALGAGGGPGLGIRASETPNAPFYVSVDAQHWARYGADWELGVQPLYAAMRGAPRTIAESGVRIDLPEAAAQEQAIPAVTRLSAPTPNPFNPRVQLAFSLALPTSVELKVYDLRGRLVATLVDEARAPGDYVEVWGGTDASGRAVASGTYFARFAAGGVVQTQRMVLLR